MSLGSHYPPDLLSCLRLGGATSPVKTFFCGQGNARVALPQAISADGGRYAGDKIEFWIKGNTATLGRGGASETCAAD